MYVPTDKVKFINFRLKINSSIEVKVVNFETVIFAKLKIKSETKKKNQKV